MIYKIINEKEMEKELKKVQDYHLLTVKEIQKKVKSFIKDLQDKYNH